MAIGLSHGGTNVYSAGERSNQLWVATQDGLVLFERAGIGQWREAQRALLANYPKPIIACIRGFCLGGGMQVAMAADIRISSDNSQFGIPAARLGIAYGYDGLRHLVSLVGPSWARLIASRNWPTVPTFTMRPVTGSG